MNRRPRLALCESKAQEVLGALGVAQLPVDPVWIAEQHDILVEAKPANAPGVSGMLVRCGEEFAIAYATHIKNAGFQRFSIAHELGHYFLPGHPDALFAESAIHHSKAGFTSSDPIELEADHFAAALLMPKPLFLQSLRRRERDPQGIDALIGVASDCATSLEATAIRYTRFSDLPVAVVVSSGPRIDYCFISDSLRELPNLEWPRKGSSLPVGSATSTFNLQFKQLLGGERDEGTTSISEWFGGTFEIAATEEIVGLGRYGKTLTLVAAVDSIDPEELLEEQELLESWTPRFRR